MTTILNKSEFEKIIERINKLTHESKGLWGKMTVHEMFCHISDPIRDILGIRITEPVTPPEIRAKIISMVLTESDWDKNIPTFPPYLQSEDGGGTKPTKFDNDKKSLLDLVHKLYSTTTDYNYYPHAGLGMLTREQIGQFIWKHTDHHLRQFGV